LDVIYEIARIMAVIKTLQSYIQEGTTPEILFWVGCAGSYDERAQRVSKAFAEILNKANVSLQF
jgi:heterodisulfide reductase subunit D